MPAEFSDPKFPSYGEGREGEQQRTPAVRRTLVTAWHAAGCSALGGSATSSADASTEQQQQSAEAALLKSFVDFLGSMQLRITRTCMSLLCLQ